MVCNARREANHDGIVPETYPHLISELEAQGIKVAFNKAGFLPIPD